MTLRHMLQAEVLAFYQALADWRPWLLTGLLALMLIGAAQLPMRYPIMIGQPDGMASDLPLIDRFYGAEQSSAGRFRWTGARSTIQLNGFGQQPLPIVLRLQPVTAPILALVPSAEIWSGQRRVAELPIRLDGTTYHLLMPAAEQPRTIEIRSATFRAPSDERDLGVPVGMVVVQHSQLGWPDWGVLVAWLAIPMICWCALRRAEFGAHAAAFACAALSCQITIASALDPPRAALAPLPFTRALLGGWLLLIVLKALTPKLFRALNIPLSTRSLRWLVALAALVFTLRYGGKLYPGAMPGDIAFHTNRFVELLAGRVFLQAPHRGVEAPYPPAAYVMLAPLLLARLTPRAALVLSSALVDALSPLAIYAIVAASAARRLNQRAALLAAGFYAIAPGGMLAAWWNFSTHIITQFSNLLLIAGLVFGVGELQTHARDRSARHQIPTLAVLVLLQALVYLGHFSYYVNASLLIASALLVLIAVTLYGRFEPQLMRRMIASAVLAQLLVAGFFYSFYLALFRQQAAAVESVATALRDWGSLRAFIGSMLGEGLRDHIGLFPAAFVLCGVGRQLLGRDRLRPAAGALLSGTLLIAGTFALLPIFSGANLTTRWLMFSLWALSIAGAPSALQFWRRGYAGRIMAGVIGTYLVWISAAIWLEALAWRIRPPEIF
jgi:hypothetical protein